MWWELYDFTRQVETGRSMHKLTEAYKTVKTLSENPDIDMIAS